MLSNVAKRYLRGLGHHLDPVLNVGKEGVDPGLIKAIRSALLSHELIKIKLNQNALSERSTTVLELAQATASDVVQEIGRTALLYKAHPKEPKIVLPANAKKLRRLKNKPKL